MSIRVTCAGCHTRFSVSEKFAGREGPCPKCKAVIKIPSAAEEVTVHGPESYGPKGLSGAAVLKPLFRQETRLSAVQIVLIFATIAGILAIALVMRYGVENREGLASWLLIVLSVLIAAPCVVAGYSFLRDSERGALGGNDYWIRIACCSTVYGLSWGSFWLVNLALLDDYGTTTRVIAVAGMFVVGAVTATLFLGLDFLMGVLHYGLFFGCCVLLRLILGLTVLPGSVEPVVFDPALALVTPFLVSATLLQGT